MAFDMRRVQSLFGPFFFQFRVHSFLPRTNHCSSVGADGSVTVEPTSAQYKFTTETKLPKLGMMLVGWGGNNGSTVTASIVANRKKMTWQTRIGTQKANYMGSVTQSSTINMGPDAETGHDVYVPLSSVVPMVHGPLITVVSVIALPSVVLLGRCGILIRATYGFRNEYNEEK